MAYYMLAIVDVHDKEAYVEYQEAAAAIIGPHLARVHAITETVDLLEGEFPASILVLFEFASEDDFRAWWDSEEYARAKELRLTHATTRLIVGFEGMVAPALSL